LNLVRRYNLKPLRLPSWLLFGHHMKTQPDKSAHPTPDGAVGSALRFTSFLSAWPSTGRQA
jgi:hypothetical protein